MIYGRVQCAAVLLRTSKVGTRASAGECSLTWRGFRVPLPPVGQGWGRLLYLDEELRIQRDVRGDTIIATKVS